MPRLSLWKDLHSNDFKYFDHRISELFTVGGTAILVHKYIGTNVQGTQIVTTLTQGSANNVLTFGNTALVNVGDSVNGAAIIPGTTVLSKDAANVSISTNTTSAIATGTTIGFSQNASIPSYVNQSEQNIQDLLFVENRDRKYDPDVYRLRGHYQIPDQDFDLSQFGLFLTSGTLFMVFHKRDMVDTIGRTIMAGDVLELPHLTDYDALNQDVPTALKRFFVVGDCSNASEGFSPTWWPHLWRCKINPLVDGQEYKDLLNSLTLSPTNPTPIGKYLSAYDNILAVNDAVIKQAESDVPKSGYDTSPLFIKPLDPNGNLIENVSNTADTVALDASDVADEADEAVASPLAVVQGYLTGDTNAPNGFPITAAITFPDNPMTGDYVLRTDYLPNRVFRFNGNYWVKITDVQRTSLTQGADNKTQLGTFVNDSGTFTDSQGKVHNEKQSLSKGLTPKADN